ncbi:hypothetical protein BGZ68_003995 [Mortierella alpina]|nr:hypothetical protein BGZ68_003995 [Mortierella alpina]
MPPGMPVIPPRMQQQQQQELIQQHRRQQHMQMQQMQHMQQRQQMQGMNHARSVSSGSNRTDPRPLNTKASSGSLTTNGRRLRSESNPAHSSHHQRSPSSGTSASQGLYINTSAFVVGHSRTKSNSDNSNSNSSGMSSGSPRSQSRALADSPSTATATRSNTTGSSFQERMRERDREKQQREREERDAAARAILDDPKLSATLLNQPTSTTTAAAVAQSTGTAIWNRLRAAKDVINATITGEERWPDSDDSDHEGESHVSRMLREYADKKEAAEVAAKIAELEMTPISSAASPPVSASESLSKSLSNRGIHRRPPDTARYDNGALNNRTLRSSPSATSLRGDYYGQSLRSRGETGHQPALSEDGSRSAPTSTNSRTNTFSNNNDTTNSISLGRSGSGRNGSNLTKSKSSGGPVGSNKLGNRFRTSSDASLSEALGRLEGKRNQDALVAQVSHLGSTRARSPHRGNRAHLDNVDEVPPPPLPTPKSSFRQHAQNSEQLLHSSPSRRAGAGALASSGSNNNNNADLGAYGQHLLQLQQKQ